MRTHGHREESITPWVCWRGTGVGQQGVGRMARDNMGEMPDTGDGGMEAANHHGMCIPMQQSRKICTCTPELKVKFKKKRKRITGLKRQWDRIF